MQRLGFTHYLSDHSFHHTSESYLLSHMSLLFLGQRSKKVKGTDMPLLLGCIGNNFVNIVLYFVHLRKKNQS